MWNDRLRIADSVLADWRALAPADRQLAAEALRTIDDDPIIGAPLFEPLKGLWSYRPEELRIVYRIVTEGRFVMILSITRVINSAS
jgi:mRNA-degrading endonuclease RelE of RelBE toxin-antitoxin system